ncbi:hypothetical protein HID58_043170 [Brassica napus]|uniref:Uncharacterized protein n=4 Tax=Brassica TaxID=3705 RepID=A0ABQ8BGV0_BRANA|nr:hypothetical protein HID58_043170 [Brassica napus]
MQPKPYDIVAADPGYVRSPISLLFWHIFCFGTSEEMRHHQRNPQERGSNILLRKTPSLKKSKAKPKEMAKNINSVSITVLFFVLLVASTEILKSEAQTFCFECGPVPFLGTNADCFNCCKTKYGSPPVVSGVVEGREKHCHCYC